jgi:plasmid stabilization system protein ParE
VSPRRSISTRSGISSLNIDAADRWIYRVQDELIEIVAVTQGARDIPAFLSQRTQ